MSLHEGTKLDDISGPTGSSLSILLDTVRGIQAQIGRKLFGLHRTVEELLIALMAGGHILLEDVPGVGKSALAKSFAELLGLTFRRIQCTPDLLPSDILGGLVYHSQSGEFQLRRGPIFSNILLVDEINRALPRTQSALLEAMAEGQVTIDGESYPLPQPFMVLATQNPLESQGVFPLPEAQLDRFLMKTTLGYPTEDADLQILQEQLFPQTPLRSPSLICSSQDVISTLLDAPHQVQMVPDVMTYISRIVRATREHTDVQVGASPRAMIMLAKSARAAAALAGRSYVIPDDVVRVAPLVLYHRLVFRGYSGDSEPSPTEWTKDLLRTIPMPLDIPQS